MSETCNNCPYKHSKNFSFDPFLDTEPQIIINEGADDDYLHKTNFSFKTKKFNTSFTPPQNKKSKTSNNDYGDDIIQKPIYKNLNRGVADFEIDDKGNTVSTKVTESLYKKYVNRNNNKSKNIDILSKIKDEELLQSKEATKTSSDSKRINNMIIRQDNYEKLKINNRKIRQKEVIKQIKSENNFKSPTKRKANKSPRSPLEFYKDQQQYSQKVENKIQQLGNSILKNEKENSNIILTSKLSEKLANLKNPNETKKDFCNRLANEKLKNIKEIPINIEKRKHYKKLSREEVINLSEKLYKESEKFRNNRDKRQQQINNLLKRNLGNNEFTLQKSNQVLLEKFLFNYKKTLIELFNQTNNIKINFEDYKKILICLGCIKNFNNAEKLIKDSFYNYLKPVENQIYIYSFILFALSFLGIYKGYNDENNKKFFEIINDYFPNFDFQKCNYYNNKQVKIIKNNFSLFNTGINIKWKNELIKKKQERLEKNGELNKNNLNNVKTKNKSIKLKKDGNIIKSYHKKLLEENSTDLSLSKNKTNKNLLKSYKIENMSEIFLKRKKREIERLKAKQESKFLNECTFQPNSKTKPVNKSSIKKDIEKLYITGKDSYIRKKNSLNKNNEDMLENTLNCTFKPNLNNKYNGAYFNYNPLKNDKKLKNEINKMTKLREVQGYLNMEIKIPMAFDIENKRDKDEIQRRVGSSADKYEKYEFYEQIENVFDEDDEKSLLKMQVNLDENYNNVDKLIIHPGDDIMEMIDKFCEKNNFNDDKKNKLISVIKERINITEDGIDYK